MSNDLVPQLLLPPGVKDERQAAFIGALNAKLESIDINAFVMTDAETVPDELVPFMAREFSVQEFLTDDLPLAFVRRFINQAYAIHASKGYIEGTRLGLEMLGVHVEWVQWWQTNPKGPHNTHTVTAFASENVFAEEATVLNARLQRAIQRVIDATKRWSQDVSFQIGAGYTEPVRVGSAFAGFAFHHATFSNC